MDLTGMKFAVVGREKKGGECSRWMRGRAEKGTAGVSGPEGSVHYPGMEQPALRHTPGTRLD